MRRSVWDLVFKRYTEKKGALNLASTTGVTGALVEVFGASCETHTKKLNGRPNNAYCAGYVKAYMVLTSFSYFLSFQYRSSLKLR